jgi:hypothetical protein
MEARGNQRSYPAQGVDVVRASLNWGPLTWLNEVSRTFGWWQSRRGTFNEDFHTYVLEWSDKFMLVSQYFFVAYLSWSVLTSSRFHLSDGHLSTRAFIT